MRAPQAAAKRRRLARAAALATANAQRADRPTDRRPLVAVVQYGSKPTSNHPPHDAAAHLEAQRMHSRLVAILWNSERT